MFLPGCFSVVNQGGPGPTATPLGMQTPGDDEEDDDEDDDDDEDEDDDDDDDNNIGGLVDDDDDDDDDDEDDEEVGPVEALSNAKLSDTRKP